MQKLNERKIRDARPGQKDAWLGDGDGLWLRIRTSGTKTFVLRRKSAGKTTIETLGDWPQHTLKTARQAAERRRLLEVNPGALTVGEAVRTFLDRVIERRYRRPEQIKGYLERDLKTIADKQLVDVRRSHLSAIIQAKVEDGPVAANRLLESIRRFFRYCAEMGWVEDSPATALSRNIAGGPEEPRARVLSDDEIRKVWAVPAPHGPLLRFLMLTGARIGEAQRARWMDVDGETWRIPAEYSKNGREHVVHLSTQARAELTALPRRGDGLIFGARTDTAVQAWLKRWCERENIEPRFTPHDCRRTFSTRMNSIGIAPHVVEKCLNHTMQGVMAVYNRAEYLEERRAAFLALGRELERIVLLT